ncbi:hypothetical protein OAA60_03060 [Porticoccaceae bacterium]|nr:hypothetical protein [Porticoccaceae bacterium]
MPGSVSDKLMGLLSDPRTMDIGMGLLSAGGPSFTPHNMGQDMASAYQYANGREGQRAQLEMQRAQLNQQKKQAAARAKLGQVMANRQTPQQIGQGVAGQMGILGAGPGMLNPQTQAQYGRATAGLNAINNQRQQQIPGLLMEAYPNQAGGVMAGLLGGKAPTQPSSVREFEYANSLPPEQRAAYLAQINSGNEMSAADKARLLQIEASTQRAAKEAELGAQERNQNTTRRELGATRGVEKIDEILDVMDKVSGTSSQSGAWAGARQVGAGSLAELLRLTGGDPSKMEGISSDIQVLGKKFSELSSGAIPDAFMGSDAKATMFAEQLPKVNLEEGAILEILKTTLNGIIDEEQIYNGPDADTPRIRNARETLQRINSWGGSAVPPPPPGFEVDQ